MNESKARSEKSIGRPQPTTGRKSKQDGVCLPDEPTLADIARQLHLSPNQTHHLRLTLQHVHADLDAYHANPVQADRRELVRRLKQVETAFAVLDDACSRHAKYIGRFPSDFLEEAGAILTFSALNNALGRNVTPRHVETAVRDHFAAGEALSIETVDALTLASRQSMGIKHGAEVLPAIIQRLHAPLRKWVELDKLNKGGRSANLARRYLVTRLAEAAPEIVGRKASRAQTGPFVRLCEVVLPACGIDADGVEQLVPRIVAPATPKRKA